MKKYLVTLAIDMGDHTKVNQLILNAKSEKKMLKALWKECDKDEQFNNHKEWLQNHNDEYQEIALISIIELFYDFKPSTKVVYDLNQLGCQLEVIENKIKPLS